MSAPHPVPHASRFAVARDDLLQQILTCRVRDAAPEQQAPWFDDALDYLQERYPDLTPRELAELRLIGERFCKPPIGATG